jgi:hypothetical protein
MASGCRPAANTARILRLRDGAREQARIHAPRAALSHRSLEQPDALPDVLEAVEHAQERRERGDLGRVDLDGALGSSAQLSSGRRLVERVAVVEGNGVLERRYRVVVKRPLSAASTRAAG